MKPWACVCGAVGTSETARRFHADTDCRWWLTEAGWTAAGVDRG